MVSLDFIVYDFFSFSELLIILTCLLKKWIYYSNALIKALKPLSWFLYTTLKTVFICIFQEGTKLLPFYDRGELN